MIIERLTVIPNRQGRNTGRNTVPTVQEALALVVLAPKSACPASNPNHARSFEWQGHERRRSAAGGQERQSRQRALPKARVNAGLCRRVDLRISVDSQKKPASRAGRQGVPHEETGNSSGMIWFPRPSAYHHRAGVPSPEPPGWAAYFMRRRERGRGDFLLVRRPFCWVRLNQNSYRLGANLRSPRPSAWLGRCPPRLPSQDFMIR